MVRHFFKGNKMANRFFQQFFFSLNHAPVFLEGSVVIGATGAVGTVKGSGLLGVTRLAAGVYQLQFEDAYNRYLGGTAGFVSPVTGASVPGGSFVAGTLYYITALGTTTTAQWLAAGVPAGVTPAVGVAFVATTVGAGTGTVKAAGVSGIYAIEVAGNSNLTSYNSVAGKGAILVLQCLDAAGAQTDPAAGSVLGFTSFFRNSTVKGKGE
jgi:hypothetical protein